MDDWYFIIYHECFHQLHQISPRYSHFQLDALVTQFPIVLFWCYFDVTDTSDVVLASFTLTGMVINEVYWYSCTSYDLVLKLSHPVMLLS